MINIFRCTKDNGCLEVLPGSHRFGRLNHTKQAEQMAVEPERLREIMKKVPPVQVEMDPGDALFFHCNLVHGR